MTDQRTEPETAPVNGGGTLLDASHISKVFGGLVAVNDVTFRVPPKAIVSLIGPNGAGKTTFFNCLTGLYRPTTGRVVFDGSDITAKRADLVTRAGIAASRSSTSASSRKTVCIRWFPQARTCTR